MSDVRPRDERLHDLAGAWSLDAVTDAERAEFEAYLLSDDDARAEATELADTAALLGAAVPSEQPSAALKTRLMAAIEGMPQAAPAVDAAPRSASSATPVAAASVPAEGEATASASDRTPSLASRSTSREGRVYRFTRRTAAMFALAAAMLVGLTVGGIAIQHSLTPSASTVAIGQIKDAGDARSARASVSGGGSAELVWSASQHRSAVTVDGVKDLASGKVYQLWYIGKDGAVSAGTFTRGAGSQSVVLTGRYHSGDTIGMTVEPSGGSQQPTTTPVVAITTA